MQTKEISISIRNLVEFILRTGDIDSGFMCSSRAVEGTKAHRAVQKSYGDEYSAEVELTYKVSYKGFLIKIEGRADGIIKRGESVAIDEIKTVKRDVDSIQDDYNPLHWAQAECYAYIYGAQNNISEIDVQLTYYQMDNGNIKYFVRTYKIQELKEKFYSLIDRYLVWIEMEQDWIEKRNESIEKLAFPFESYRKGQREMAVAVYKTITEGKKIFIKAPTGIGKTISTLFPSVKALGAGHVSKIFYLTAKSAARQAALDALLKMKECGLQFKASVITAKDKICFKEKTSCNAEECEFAMGHFDRVNDAVLDILKHEEIITRETVETYARKHSVCPFEFSLDITLWVDCIICDYNYVFDPKVYLKRFFIESKGDYAFLIDEAHNLVDRAREMYSSQISKKSILQLKKLMKGRKTGVKKIIDKLNTEMIAIRKACDDKGFFVQEEKPDEFCSLLREFIKESEAYLQSGIRDEAYEEMIELYFSAVSFIRISDMYDKRYVTYVEKNDDTIIKLFCIDPSYILSDALKRGKASVFFSATLLPLNYYREILGGENDDYTMQLKSPFEKENLCLLIGGNISTKYRNRENTYDIIARYIKAVSEKRTGNYLAFFPSYEYMREVYSVFINNFPETKTLLQSSSMTEDDKEAFLYEFKPDSAETLVGFAVLGGSFSEGIDLKGERLIGTVIVGVGLPQMCPERDIIRNYFDMKNNLGYEYAYMYPGMNKVMQAAGRVIRTEEDRGVVLLIDDRFLKPNYRKLYPVEWELFTKIGRLEDIEKHIEAFWNG